ncbi:MAG: tRNA adenosine(34) deaminase TadA [Endozoicomonas sp. (ex Botrylloides leachii)]|nr:tRNA adenosine(34) deaminase TadA [Endozoicomonas sp. (ex Botrylloides leachii)]
MTDLSNISNNVWMAEALDEARKAALKGEVPVGAVVVYDKKIIARAHNQPISSCNPVAHAEILVLQAAAIAIGNYRLINCDLYVTLEPCTMCAGALVHSRVRRVIYGASEPKAGAIVSMSNVLAQPQMNYKIKVTAGVMAKECSEIISAFFKMRRQQVKEKVAL